MKNGIYIEKYAGWSNTKSHYKDNKLKYREYTDGGKEYYNEEAQLHREDGPALEYPNSKQWWLNGNFIDVETQEGFEKHLLLQVFK